MWLLICAIAIMLMLGGTVYLSMVLSNQLIMGRISDKRILCVLLALLLIVVVFFVLKELMTFVNALVILLHMVGFTLFFDVVMRVIRPFVTFGSKSGLHVMLSLVTTILYLLVGYYLCTNVWQTDYHLTTKKELGTLRIAMFADSHVGATFDGEGFEKHLKSIESQSPDILCISGDYVDDWSNKKDMLEACEALGRTRFKYGVWLVFGNHDEGFFKSRDFDAQELRQALKDNGVHVLEDEYDLVDNRFYVAGRRDSMHNNRKDMESLLSGVDKSKYIILLDHEPNDYVNESGYADLVLSGHTHGGQMFPINIISYLSGVNDRIYGHENREGTDFIVTSGISDWDILFKTGTKSEYVIIDIGKTDPGTM